MFKLRIIRRAIRLNGSSFVIVKQKNSSQMLIKINHIDNNLLLMKHIGSLSQTNLTGKFWLRANKTENVIQKLKTPKYFLNLQRFV